MLMARERLWTRASAQIKDAREPWLDASVDGWGGVKKTLCLMEGVIMRRR